MKNYFCRLICLTLVFLMFISNISILSLSANADDSDGNNTQESNTEIYYSDLFFGYPFYLTSNPYYDSYCYDTESTFESLYQNYTHSRSVVGTSLEKAMGTVTSITEIAKMASDLFGLTKFDYNEALDNANQKFISELITYDEIEEITKAYGKTDKIIKGFQQLFNIYDFGIEHQESGKSKTIEEIIREGYDSLYNGGYLKHFKENDLYNTWLAIHTDKWRLKDDFDYSHEIVSSLKAMFSSMIIENVRMEVVDEILATTPSKSVVHEGMNRLKKQLQGGWLTYYIDTYVKSNIIDDICGMIDKEFNSLIGFDEVSKVMGIVKYVVFSILIDVPSYDDILAYQVLNTYHFELKEAIDSKAAAFSNDPTTSDIIIEYEALWDGYIAANNATLKILESISSGKKDKNIIEKAFLVARENNVEQVTISGFGTSMSVPANSDINEIEIAINSLILSHYTGMPEKITLSDGKNKYNIISSTSLIYNFMSEATFNCKAQIADYKAKYGGADVYNSYISGCKEYVSIIAPESRIGVPKSVYSNWTFSTPIQLRVQSDDIEKGCVYASNNIIHGNLIMSGNMDFPDVPEIVIDGNVTFEKSFTFKNEVTILENLIIDNADGCTLTIGSNGILNVQNDVNVSVSKNFWGGYSGTSVIVDTNGVFNVGQNFNLKGYWGTLYNPRICYLTVKGTLNVNKNFNCNTVTEVNDSGTINIYGNANFIAEGNWVNVTVSNIYINGDMNVFGNMKLQGGSVGNTGNNWFLLHVDGKVYCKNFSAINRFVAIYQTSEQSEWVVAYDFDINVLNDSRIPGFDVEKDDGYVCEFSAGCLKIGGNFNNSGKIITPTGTHEIILNGNTTQNITNLNARTLILNNQSNAGTVFKSPINVYYLFNHNRNAFTLYNNGEKSSFVDYDGDGIKDNVDPYPLIPNHKTVQHITGKNPTCSETGDKEYWHCLDCGKNFSDPDCRFEITGDINEWKTIFATGEHVDADGVWETDGTRHWHTCSCGATFDETAHSGGTATCQEKAVCSICGVTYGDVKSNSHKNITIINEKKPSCTEKGYTGDVYCLACGELVSSGETIPANGHVFTKHEAYDATCEGQGNIEYYVCEVCGHWFTDANGMYEIMNHNTVITLELGHDWDDGEITVEATEYEDGVRTYTCRRCKNTRTEVIPALGHTHKYEDTVVSPTCENDGYTVHTCKCGDTYSDNTVKALGHRPGEGPTCTEDQVCERCKAVLQEKTGHHYTAVVTDPICTEDGYTTHTCDCGDKYVDSYVDKLGHDWDDGVVTAEPTETTKGVKTFTCQRCHKTKTEVIPELAHTHKLTKVAAKDATCQNDGNIEYYVCDCGKWFIDAEGQNEIVDHNSIVIGKLMHIDENKDGKCDDCKTDMEVPSIEYVITEGANCVWAQDSQSGAKFQSNAEFARFSKVLVDGNVVASDKYTVVEGSTVVTLTKEYLGSLVLGKHSLTIVSNDGEASTEFTVISGEGVPQTGDSAIFCVVIAVAMLLGMSIKLGGKRHMVFE